MKHISLPFTEESALGLNGLGRSKCAPAPRLGGLQHAHTATAGVCSPPPSDPRSAIIQSETRALRPFGGPLISKRDRRGGGGGAGWDKKAFSCYCDISQRFGVRCTGNHDGTYEVWGERGSTRHVSPG